jgi:hypothetical protein
VLLYQIAESWPWAWRIWRPEINITTLADERQDQSSRDVGDAMQVSKVVLIILVKYLSWFRLQDALGWA